MSNYYFRCYSVKDKIWIFTDMEIRSADFPDYLKMFQIAQNPDNYKLTIATNSSDSKGTKIYENDILKYKDSIYLITQADYGFVLKCIEGRNIAYEIIPEQGIIIGNIFEDPYLLLKRLTGQIFFS